ncbi:MAG: DinB family protein [Vicinamibacterales bacterium]
MRIIAEALLQELDREVPASRRVLERLPVDQFEWRPHPRSMTVAQLGLHVASIPGNVARLAQTDGFDVATAPGSYPAAASSAALLETFDGAIASLRDVLAHMDDEAANAPWRLAFSGREIATWSRTTLVRTMGLNHWYHHRGELVVYLRLLGVPVPVVYGRSADENPFAVTAA